MANRGWSAFALGSTSATTKANASCASMLRRGSASASTLRYTVVTLITTTIYTVTSGAALGGSSFRGWHPLLSGTSRSPHHSLMNTRNPLERHRAEGLRLAAQYGATDVRVFGSFARGDSDEHSDIDLLVRMMPGRSLFDIGGLLMDLRDLFGTPVHVVAECGLRPRMRKRVLHEAILI